MFRSNPFELTTPIKDFDAIRIMLASPEKIRSWSHGEVTKPETINYRTFKPERDGLFCARIFGPVTDWECLCGKYKRMKHRGVICDKCGVEVTVSKVRRERMGHIELASPCSHVWFFKGLPSRIGHLLDISLRDLESILYFESYVVVDPGDAPVKEREVIKDENRFRELDQQYRPTGFKAMMGAEAIKELLKRVNSDELSVEMREKMKTETSVQKKIKYSKRLKVVEAFRKSGNKPQWMILDVLPVIPPELRPLVPLDGGRFATSDLNDLYRRVINRNNRLKKLMDLHAPEVIVRNEKRMLQEAVDALFDNGRRGRVLRGANNRPLKSLSDTLKGKQGRFRQNLLGKRVDYSGRSVIVVGPELKLHQCGLPKKMALELFKPFIYHRLEQTGHCTTIKQAKEMVEMQEPVVWDILEEVIKDHPILLNRAPTLHRLGIQAFEPVLVEGKAIKIHPLVCTAFNADFDGDQMAVHIPLSPEAQIEASVLMLAAHNILSPASGQPITVPTQDLVLGLYYLTKAKAGGAKGEGRTFANAEEVLMALEAQEVETLSPIRLRYTGTVLDMTTAYDDQDLMHTDSIEYNKQFISTTVGRTILNDALPDGMPFINGLLKKKGIGQLVSYCNQNLGLEVTVRMLDRIKELGFQYATRSGLSVGLDDMVIPASKYTTVSDADQKVIEVQQQYLDGAITNGERSNKVIQIWSAVTEKVADEMFGNMKTADKEGAMNPIYIMADSGARGSKQQIRQLSGMRGLMAKPSGEVIETPITANFREGLTVLEYFISTHGARKGLADTALKTADSGYLTRRLVDVAQDVIVTEMDCGTVEGIYVSPIVESGEIIEPLRDRIIGRVSLERIKDFDGKIIVDLNQQIDEEMASMIQSVGVEKVKIRSVLTCESRRGVCALCYGRNLGSGRMVEMGETCGVIAAQSIGEPGTQLTMRTFHVGGTASRVSDKSRLDAKNNGTVHFINLNTVKSEKDGMLVAMNRSGSIAIVDDRGREKERYQVVYGARMRVEDGSKVALGDQLAEWDPYTYAVLTEIGGTVQFKDLQEGITLNEEVDEVTGLSRLVVSDAPDEKRQPAIWINGAKGKKRYLMPSRAHLMVLDGDVVGPGDILAKIPRESTRTKDITGGLPRVVELFEARKPRETAIISEIDGVVRFGEVAKGQRKIYVTADNGEEKEYSVPRGIHVNIQEGERLSAGDPLMDGPLNPHDILNVLGEKLLQAYLVNEIQEVYRLQGVTISDKHIEVIVRQMLRWVRIEDVGDTNFLLEQQVDRFRYNEENDRVLALGGRPCLGRPLLLGITKASLSTDSFISAASFQETTRVLTEASINGAIDGLRGLKENVIVGRLIPAGTGLDYYRSVQLSPELEEAAERVKQEVNAEFEAAERELEMMRQEGEAEEMAAE